MWQLILDILFPKKCINCRKFGNYLCSNCFSKINFNDNYQCSHCFRAALNGFTHPNCQKALGLDGVIPAVNYSKVIKKLIYQLKYAPNLKVLARPMARLMVEGLSQNESFYAYIIKYQPTILPIPLSSKRMRTRGYNHAELIASYVAQYFKLNLRSNVLVRIKDTRPQYELNKKERIKNIRGAFGIKSNAKVPSSIILLDDIATTYSTLKECAKILKRNGAKRVIGITFAKEA